VLARAGLAFRGGVGPVGGGRRRASQVAGGLGRPDGVFGRPEGIRGREGLRRRDGLGGGEGLGGRIWLIGRVRLGRRIRLRRGARVGLGCGGRVGLGCGGRVGLRLRGLRLRGSRLRGLRLRGLRLRGVSVGRRGLGICGLLPPGFGIVALAGRRSRRCGGVRSRRRSGRRRQVGSSGSAASGPAGACGVQRRIGPSSGLPSRTTQSMVISIRSDRSGPRNVPFVLPRSSRTQVSPSIRSCACRHETRESVSTMSDCGSRPMTYVRPAWNSCTERRLRTARSGGTDGADPGGMAWGGAASASPGPAWDCPACGGCRSDQSKRSGGMLPKCRAARPKRESAEPFTLRQQFDILGAGQPDTGMSGSSAQYRGPYEP
jgi:hypothetical protein